MTVARWYPDLAPLVKVSSPVQEPGTVARPHTHQGGVPPLLAPSLQVTVVEAGPNILGTFDAALVDYYSANLTKRSIDVRTDPSVLPIAYTDAPACTPACASAHH